MCVIAGSLGAVPGCDQAGPQQSSPIRHPLQVQAASSLRDLMPRLVEAYEQSHPNSDINPRYAGSQALARQIDAGVEVDVFLSADESAVDLLARQPTSRREWISNELVVIAPVGSEIILDDLGMGDGPVAIAAEAVPLGRYTRLALRMKELWRVVEARSTQFASAAAVLQQVATGSFDLGIVYSTDAALESERVRVLGTLPLPESVDVVYVAASFTPEGDAFVAWLATPEANAIATDAGFSLAHGRNAEAPGESGS